MAVKGIGGYHLACDATDEPAVARLRTRKHREEKPLAVMTTAPHTLAEVTPEEDALLRGPERPIVLVRRRPGAPIAPSVAAGSPWLGLILPYTPLHHLLCHDVGRPLVLTSGNRSDEPIAIDDDEARRRLGGIADAFLSHDRPIHRRCEDSVVRAAFPVRRSRGYSPGPLPLPLPSMTPVVAAGAELKSTFCVARGAEAFLSPHLGDLDSEAAYAAFRADLALYLDMLGVEPEAIACDLHPEYLATKWAGEQGLPLIEVQHHHAHAAACLAEHGETGEALAVVLDGTGMGTDGTLWGGEVLRCDLVSFERIAHLEPVPLPGGEAAIREPWRMAASYLERAGRPVPFERWPLVRESLKVNAPPSSGAGRLFDAVAALLGLHETVTYEGQAAIALEQLAGDTVASPYACTVDGGAIRGADLVAAAFDDLAAGRPRTEIAAAFHEGVAAAFATACSSAGRTGHGGPLRRQFPEPATAHLSPQSPGGSGLPRPLAPSRAAERRRSQLRSGSSRSRNARSLLMCLGIPGQVIEVVDRDAGLAKVDISGVRRDVSVALVDEPTAPIEVGDWVLIHVGFALARIDEDDARETLALLERGAELQRELDELRLGTV